MSSPELPLLALTLGDPSGIGPEIVRAAVRDERVRSSARVLVLGPACERIPGVPLVESEFDRDATEPVRFLATGAGERSWELARPQASAGRAALDALACGAELAHEGRVDALVTAPVSKEALHLAGERVEGQTELLSRWAEVDVRMLAIAGRLRVALLTRHMPLRDALAAIEKDAVVDALADLARGLGRLGWDEPRLGLAGLNPHAGEHGLLGCEETDVLIPAALEARARGLDVTGPVPPDTLFLRASRGEFDAVLALYHDQAFIPVKLHAPETGLTVLLGLPYLRVSPAHGTAFDIVGTGQASPENLILALEQAAAWAAQR